MATSLEVTGPLGGADTSRLFVTVQVSARALPHASDRLKTRPEDGNGAENQEPDA
ncbi:hypothetical protein ACFY8C_38565 [Streptomyces flavochromogenes]|uniref:Uncharacterized protein n=1 Tax=Streptomyces flavochromogenes TaxID=68199 RepID=A0ABW6Y347_9ACTN